MSSRPTVRRTYGKARLAPSSSSLMFEASSPAPFTSSPPSSARLATPPPLFDQDGIDLHVPSSPSPIRQATITLGTPEDEDELEIGMVAKAEAVEAKLEQSSAKASLKREFAASPQSPSSATKKPMQSSLTGFFAPLPKKRPLAERSTIPPSTPVAGPSTPSSMSKIKTEIKSGMTQMHLTHLPLLHSCKECSMSYVRGGEDEALHAKHHVKVIRGIPWEGLGKGKGKQKASDMGWKVVAEHLEFGAGRDKGKGRVVMCEGSWVGQKLNEILATVDTVLSSPAIETPMLDRCKIFLYLTSSPPPSTKKARPLPGGKQRSSVERIVSVVVAQPIKVAMRVLSDGEDGHGCVDSGSGVLCDPEQLPTSLGIHRIFTVPAYRYLGLAQTLLDASCRHTVYGCHFDPSKGDVAFSQPTESGRKTMERWGGGHVRVFIEDERQL